MGKLLELTEINGQQQQQSTTATTTAAAAATATTTTTTTTATQQQQQQQYSTTCSTMPAMPNESKATAVSLSESNFTELKLKELATSAAVVAATAATAAAAMATTATATNRLSNNTTMTTQQNMKHHQHQHHHQHQQQQHRNTCGCGAASAETTTTTLNRNKYLATNGHSSPLAEAMTTVQQQQQHQQSQQTPQTTTTNYSRYTNCHRSSSNRFQNGYHQQTRTNNESASSCTPNSTTTTTTTTTAAKTATTTTTAATSSTSANAASASSSASSSQACNQSNGYGAAVTPPKKSAKDFIFGKYIGEGSFSIVYFGLDVHTKREYAIKVCEKRHILRERKQEYIRREREVMHLMTNVPGFVNLSCTFQDPRSLYFVMTLAKNGDLLPYINKVGSFKVECARHYAAELVLACEEMHRRNVVHRDLKPENILLDENMHTLVADFGSAKLLTPEDLERAAEEAEIPPPSTRPSRAKPRSYTDEDDEDDEDTNDTGSDDVDSPSRQPRYYRRRRNSFVGTAQYVSPEVLHNGRITPAADLWALGCILYQMISGLPPFRGGNEYAIFREIVANKVEFPAGFDKKAEDLVRKLLKTNSEDRLGANDTVGYYESIRSHPFFNGIDFDKVRDQTPPPILPYFSGDSDDEDFRDKYNVPDNLHELEPGLDNKQLTRLLGMELGTALGCGGQNGSVVKEKKTEEKKHNFDLSDAEKQKCLEQQKSDKWFPFADNEVILLKGFINKRKGLFARRRMMLLTTGPRLIYIDPDKMIKKGEIPWSAELRVDPKNFKNFLIHTPNRTYYLEDPEGTANKWVEAIREMSSLTYKDQAAASAVGGTQSATSSLASASSSSSTTSATSSSSTSSTLINGVMMSTIPASSTTTTATKTASN